MGQCVRIARVPIPCTSAITISCSSQKYRKPVLRGEVGLRLRELIREICRSMEVDIIQGHFRPDHVHLLVSAPPNIAPSRSMQAIKGKTSHHLMSDFRRISKEFWGRHLWARGYFVATSENVTDEVISMYIEEQGAVPQDDADFKVTD